MAPFLFSPPPSLKWIVAGLLATIIGGAAVGVAFFMAFLLASG